MVLRIDLECFYGLEKRNSLPFWARKFYWVLYHQRKWKKNRKNFLRKILMKNYFEFLFQRIQPVIRENLSNWTFFLLFTLVSFSSKMTDFLLKERFLSTTKIFTQYTSRNFFHFQKKKIWFQNSLGPHKCREKFSAFSSFLFWIFTNFFLP